jgi:1-deoxy-D-xylulose-5-phosphate reductoisomerase
MPNVVVLGSTGSIGRAALDVIEALGDPYRLVAIAARDSVDLLADQVRRFSPAVVSVGSDSARKRLLALLGDTASTDIRVDASTDLARLPEADIVLSAVVGAVGLEPALAAVTAGKRLALANKEALVMAGHLVTRAAEAHGAEVIPVDSEHSAIFQALQGGRRDELDHITLTASGGPFQGSSAEELAAVTPSEALAHPTWQMGPKVTIDSATLMNKALEVVEARWLFGLRADQIRVLVHPQSIVHSMVTFVDGSSLAQLGTPEMLTPIQYALTYPERRPGLSADLDLAALGQLTFAEPDLARFPALRLGFEVAAAGGVAGAVLNAANEVAVEAFRGGRLSFAEIVTVTERVLSNHTPVPEPDLEQVLAADAWARKEAAQCLK